MEWTHLLLLHTVCSECIPFVCIRGVSAALSTFFLSLVTLTFDLHIHQGWDFYTVHLTAKFIILHLIVRKLSCSQTDKLTNRSRWKHPWHSAMLRRSVIINCNSSWIIRFLEQMCTSFIFVSPQWLLSYMQASYLGITTTLQHSNSTATDSAQPFSSYCCCKLLPITWYPSPRPAASRCVQASATKWLMTYASLAASLTLLYSTAIFILYSSTGMIIAILVTTAVEITLHRPVEYNWRHL